MTKTRSDVTVPFINNVADTITAVGKLLLKSRGTKFTAVDSSKPIIVMGNGPSLRETIDSDGATLQNNDTLAVNFAANAPEFFRIKPKYYVLADPFFFNAENNENVSKLFDNLCRVDWPMTLFVPVGTDLRKMPANLSVSVFNNVGIDGNRPLRHFAYSRRLAMPRPRNVLIPSIMIAAWLGYREIYIVGADHSWMRTIEVNERNEVVSLQPHFYKEDNNERRRINAEYLNYPLFQIVHSFYVAFRAYFQIVEWASENGINIYNATPDSFIDAFPRKPISSLNA